ncbi:MAG: TonB-dependent receptor, partial [Rhodanobacter sp.]
ARTAAWSIYGDATWHLNSRLNLTAGLRATRDNKTFSWYTPPRQAPGVDRTLDQLEQAGLLTLAARLAHTTPQALRAALSRNLVYADAVGQQVSRHNRWNDLSPRLVLDYHFSPNVMGYASLAKGYKAGGYNGVQVNSAFAPEQVWNLETGVKSWLPEQHLQLDASLYAYRYDNRQALTLIPSSTGIGVPQYRVSNTDQRATGLDLQAQWQPFGELRLGFNASVIDATYRHAVTASGVDLSGQPAGEPLLSWAASASYRWVDIAHGNLQLSARHGYRGRTRCNEYTIYQGSCSAATPFTLGGVRQRTDLRLAWDTRDGQWGVAVYANNLFNQRYVESIINVSTDVLGTPYAIVTPPRSWGMELRVAL